MTVTVGPVATAVAAATPVAPPDNDVLWARGLVTSHQGNPALRGVSLGVRQGEVLAVTGPRGCGKSTLLDCLGAVIAPQRGEIWFNSAPVHTLSRAGRERLRRERFGFVRAEPGLVPELTARENVALPLLVAGTGRRAADAAALEWLERLDVADCARQRAGRLFQEEQQRIAVARALVHGPTVVFADEPTAPLLRREAREQVLRMLVTAARSHGITLVLTGCDRGFAVRHADRVAEMTDGRISLPVAAGELLPRDAATGAVPAASGAGTAARPGEQC